MAYTGRPPQPSLGERWRRHGTPSYARICPRGCTDYRTWAGQSDARREAGIARWPAVACRPVRRSRRRAGRRVQDARTCADPAGHAHRAAGHRQDPPRRRMRVGPRRAERMCPGVRRPGSGPGSGAGDSRTGSGHRRRAAGRNGSDRPAGCGAEPRGAARGPGQLRASPGRRPGRRPGARGLPAAAGARYQPGAAPAVRRAGVPGPAAGHARDGGCRRPQSLAANPSVALLLDRARRTNPSFDLTPANALLLASACVRLEGLPLAIELAAARLKVLTPGELVFRLSSRMEVLAGSTRDVPARQRALRSAIAWSYDLLDSGERALFRRLSVFAGGWTLADAASVCAVNGDDVLAMVESLLDKSLIRRLPGDEQTAEFSMLESLREYAAEQLAAQRRSRGDAGQARWPLRGSRGAVRGFHRPAGGANLGAAGRPPPRGPARRAGLLSGRGAGCLALSLAAALGWYHYTRGDLGHGQALVDAVLPLAADGYDPAAMSDDAAAGGQTGVLIAAGVLAWATGEAGRAQDLLLSALERSEGRGDMRRAAIACAFLGHVARAGGEWDASADWHRRAEAGFRAGGNTQGVAWARHDLGLLARDRGDLDSAAELLRASLRDFRELDYPWAVAWSAWGLGTTLSAQGRLEEAGPLLAEALRIYTEVNDPRGVAQCLEALAYIASERAHYETAARLIGAAAALRERVAARPPDTEQARNSAVERVLARALGPQDADTLIHAGRTMPAQQAADLAMAVASGAAPDDPDRSRAGAAHPAGAASGRAGCLRPDQPADRQGARDLREDRRGPPASCDVQARCPQPGRSGCLGRHASPVRPSASAPRPDRRPRAAGYLMVFPDSRCPAPEYQAVAIGDGSPLAARWRCN